MRRLTKNASTLSLFAALAFSPACIVVAGSGAGDTKSPGSTGKANPTGTSKAKKMDGADAGTDADADADADADVDSDADATPAAVDEGATNTTTQDGKPAANTDTQDGRTATPAVKEMKPNLGGDVEKSKRDTHYAKPN